MAYFTKISRNPAGAAVYFAVMTLVSFMFTFMVELTHKHTAAIIIYTVVSSVMLFISLYALFLGFIYPLYDNRNDNDESVNIFAYFFVLATKSVTMGMIYTMMWLWDHGMFHEVNSSLVLGNWVYFIELSTFLTLGTAAPCIVDNTSPLSGLINTFDIFISKFFEYLGVALMVGHRHDLIERRNARKHSSM